MPASKRLLFVVVLLLLLLASPAHAAIHHAYPNSTTALCDCILKLRGPGDECLLHAGRYFVGPERCVAGKLHGTASQPIVIAAAGDGPVIIDGTVPIDGPWTPTADGRHVEAPSPEGQDILQLFDSATGDMRVLARFPDAGWRDKSMFYAVENWFRAAASPESTHDLTTHKGVLRDTGACADPDACCARCNTHDLAASGINATGALAILNLWSCDTGVQRITRHDASTPSVLEYDATWVGLCDTYRGGDGRYFLMGKRDFLNTDEEWLFDNDTKRVVLAAAPATRTTSFRGRVSDVALVVADASFLQIANLSFYATTLSVAGDVHDVTLASLVFNHSAVSRRSLGDIAPPIVLSLWRNAQLERQTGVAGRFLLDDVVVRNSDGPALMLSGDGSVLRDSLFEWNDYTTVGGSWPVGVPTQGKAQRATTCRTAGDGLVFERLTFRNNGAAQCFSAGGSNKVAARVSMCLFESQLAIQDDGSFVEGGGTPSTVYERNWGTDSGKAGLRWDGYYPGTLGGVMSENVIWNASALVIKGDQHNVTHNTVFDGADIAASHASHDRPRFQDERSGLDNLTVLSAGIGTGTKKFDARANQKSVFTHNLFDAVGITGAHCPDPPCQLPGTWRGNLVGADTPFDVRAELRAPYHRDFRPCPHSRVANATVGAYSYTQSDATPTSHYWIPGRRDRTRVSSPLPPNGAVGVHRNTDLMFRLPAQSASARSHAVFLGTPGDAPSAMRRVATLDGGSNVARLAVPLDADTEYAWRVETTYGGDVTIKSNTWTFRTGSTSACAVPPRPPQPPPAACTTCAACEESLCPGQRGKGKTCEDCVFANSKALSDVQCWTNGGKGGRHAFIESFCGGGERGEIDT